MTRKTVGWISSAVSVILMGCAFVTAYDAGWGMLQDGLLISAVLLFAFGTRVAWSRWQLNPHREVPNYRRQALSTLGEQIKTPWEFACEWYKPDRIAESIARFKNSGELDHPSLKTPEDIYSAEFTDWLTEQYRWAMANGIEIGGRDSHRTLVEDVNRLQARNGELTEACIGVLQKLAHVEGKRVIDGLAVDALAINAARNQLRTVLTE